MKSNKRKKNNNNSSNRKEDINIDHRHLYSKQHSDLSMYASKLNELSIMENKKYSIYSALGEDLLSVDTRDMRDDFLEMHSADQLINSFTDIDTDEVLSEYEYECDGMDVEEEEEEEEEEEDDDDDDDSDYEKEEEEDPNESNNDSNDYLNESHLLTTCKQRLYGLKDKRTIRKRRRERKTTTTTTTKNKKGKTKEVKSKAIRVINLQAEPLDRAILSVIESQPIENLDYVVFYGSHVYVTFTTSSNSPINMLLVYKVCPRIDRNVYITLDTFGYENVNKSYVREGTLSLIKTNRVQLTGMAFINGQEFIDTFTKMIPSGVSIE